MSKIIPDTVRVHPTHPHGPSSPLSVCLIGFLKSKNFSPTKFLTKIRSRGRNRKIEISSTKTLNSTKPLGIPKNPYEGIGNAENIDKKKFFPNIAGLGNPYQRDTFHCKMCVGVRLFPVMCPRAVDWKSPTYFF